jgi:long-chain acyl-CoA synthetase
MVDRAMAGDRLPMAGAVESGQARESQTEAQCSPAQDHVYPHWPWGWPVRPARVAFQELLMRPLVWALAAPRVVREVPELPPGPVLVIANHVTSYDGPLVLYALPWKLRRNLAVAMSGEMLLDYRLGRNQGSGLLNLLIRPAYWLITALFNVFPLPRARGFRHSFAHAGEAMDRGYSVMVFPEGTRSGTGGMQAFRPGIGLLAQESRVPVIPVAIVGLDEMKSGKIRWFRSGRLEIRVGAAIAIDELTAPAQIAAQLEDRLRRLRG